VVTEPLPPQLDVAAEAVADPAVSPPITSPAASTIPASFFVRTMNSTLRRELNDPQNGT
jgi:hypothetical protein